MSNPMVRIAAVVAALIVVGGVYLVAAGSGDDKPSQASSTTQTESAPAQSTAAGRADKGAYVDYTEDAVTKADGTRLIFFHAPWCPQCRELEKTINDQGLPDGVTVLKADYDSSQDLRQRYGVTIQTTVVKVDAKGDLIEKYVAYDDPQIDAVLKNLA